jgi:hypothetical protein
MTEGLPQAIVDASLGRQVIHRQAEPDDIAGSVFLLAADEAAWIRSDDHGQRRERVRALRLRDSREGYLVTRSTDGRYTTRLKPVAGEIRHEGVTMPTTTDETRRAGSAPGRSRAQRRLLGRADLVHRRHQGHAHRPRGDLRPGSDRDPL